MNQTIQEIRDNCEQYGRREQVAGVATRYHFESGRQIDFHCGNLVGDLEEAQKIISEVGRTSGEEE